MYIFYGWNVSVELGFDTMYYITVKFSIGWALIEMSPQHISGGRDIDANLTAPFRQEHGNRIKLPQTFRIGHKM